MSGHTVAQRLAAETLGTMFLLATVIGSGITAERLSGGSVALALLGNALPTGAILVVLITMLGPISGAHLNPVVTAVLALKRELPGSAALIYMLSQVVGALLGVLVAHAMFDLPLMQASVKISAGAALALSEYIAASGLVSTILLTRRAKPDAVAISVGLYITAAYWFTASTSFANPAVTLARAFSDTFAGIRLTDVPLFVVAQLAGALSGLVAAGLLVSPSRRASSG